MWESTHDAPIFNTLCCSLRCMCVSLCLCVDLQANEMILYQRTNFIAVSMLHRVFHFISLSSASFYLSVFVAFIAFQIDSYWLNCFSKHELNSCTFDWSQFVFFLFSFCLWTCLIPIYFTHECIIEFSVIFSLLFSSAHWTTLCSSSVNTQTRGHLNEHWQFPCVLNNGESVHVCVRMLCTKLMFRATAIMELPL